MTPFSEPSRRDMIVGATAAAAFSGGCGRTPRALGCLHYVLGMEPGTLDPAVCYGGSEVAIMAGIFEPLLRPHPETMQPMAGLAISYKVEREGTRYTFFLRGHQAPQGFLLPGF